MWYPFLFFLTPFPFFTYLFSFLKCDFHPTPHPYPSLSPFFFFFFFFSLFSSKISFLLSHLPLYRPRRCCCCCCPKLYKYTRKKTSPTPPSFPSFHRGLDCCLDIRRRGNGRKEGLWIVWEPKRVQFTKCARTGNLRPRMRVILEASWWGRRQRVKSILCVLEGR